MVVFFSIPRSKIVGYIFPALPAFAMLAGPWIAARADRRLTAAIGASVCLVLVLAATILQPRGAQPAAAAVRALIGPADTVVFHGRYFFDASLALNRRAPAYVVGDWSKRSDEMPDNVPRQLTEGREFDGRSGFVLIDEAAFGVLAGQPGTIWVVMRGNPAAPLPLAFAGFALAASSDGNVILRRANK